MNRLRAALQDPFLSSVLVLAGLAACGLLVLALTWRGVAASALVVEQVPYMVSGGIGGLALVAVGLGVLGIQHRRRIEARRRAELDQVLAVAHDLLAIAQRRDLP